MTLPSSLFTVIRPAGGQANDDLGETEPQTASHSTAPTQSFDNVMAQTEPAASHEKTSAAAASTTAVAAQAAPEADASMARNLMVSMIQTEIVGVQVTGTPGASSQQNSVISGQPAAANMKTFASQASKPARTRRESSPAPKAAQKTVPSNTPSVSTANSKRVGKNVPASGVVEAPAADAPERLQAADEQATVPTAEVSRGDTNKAKPARPTSAAANMTDEAQVTLLQAPKNLQDSVTVAAMPAPANQTSVRLDDSGQQTVPVGQKLPSMSSAVPQFTTPSARSAAAVSVQQPAPQSVSHLETKSAPEHLTAKVAAPLLQAVAGVSSINSSLSTTTTPAAAPAGLPVESALQADFSTTARGTGTQFATKGPEMKLTGKKNEIAGDTQQKLPTAPQNGPSGSNAARITAVTPDSGRSGGQQNLFDTNGTPSISTRTADLSAVTARQTSNPSVIMDQSGAMAERLGNMINQQAVTVRQLGANHLAVSLKLDSQTEVNLQLTRQNGQIAAAVTWERGNVSGLENHWRDLQDSLARQNVQLLPLENRGAAKTAGFTSTASSGGSYSHSGSTFDRSFRDPQSNNGQTQPRTIVIKTPAVQQKSTATAPQTASQQRWETWA